MLKVKSYEEMYGMLFEGGNPEVDYMAPIAKAKLLEWFKEGKEISIGNTIKDNKELNPDLYINDLDIPSTYGRRDVWRTIYSNLYWSVFYTRNFIVIEDETPGLCFKWYIRAS